MRVWHRIGAVVLACSVGAAVAQRADPASDAPESRSLPTRPLVQADTYDEALARWRSADDINAWIGVRFQYDVRRALQLSETQRERGGRLPIHAPDAFFAQPHGVCVDLSRFAVDTLRRIDPASKPVYLMIEFDPVAIRARCCAATGSHAFSATGSCTFSPTRSGPGTWPVRMPDTAAYIRDYAAYRGRTIVAFREMESTDKQRRTLALKQPRDPKP